MTAVRYDQRLESFYERLKSRKGNAKAIVATAKEILVIIWYMLTRRELINTEISYNGLKSIFRLTPNIISVK